VRKWGNSLAITIPKTLTREIRLRQNSEVELVVENRCTRVPSYTLDELLAAIRPSNLHKETDWGSAVGKELW